MTEQVVDVHSHPLLDSYAQVLSGETSGVTLPAWSVDEHLATMDAQGITTCILSMPDLAPHLVGAEGHTTARRLNEELAKVVADHPGRFGGFAAVPMDDMDTANAETAFALEQLGLDGVVAAPQLRGCYLGEPAYDPWFEELNRRGVPLFVHPGRPDYFDSETSRLNVSALEFMFETTRMVTSLVFSGRKTRFDQIKIIAPHGGGTIPYLAHRLSTISQMPWAYSGGAQLSPAETTAALGTFYFDLTAATSPAQLDAMRRLVPVDQLLMGFDYPMMPAATIKPGLDQLRSYDGFGEAEWVKILSGNAATLFPCLTAASSTG